MDGLSRKDTINGRGASAQRRWSIQVLLLLDRCPRSLSHLHKQRAAEANDLFEQTHRLAHASRCFLRQWRSCVTDGITKAWLAASTRAKRASRSSSHDCERWQRRKAVKIIGRAYAQDNGRLRSDDMRIVTPGQGGSYSAGLHLWLRLHRFARKCSQCNELAVGRVSRLR
jgi:uncharacterized protein (DUF885 family)